MKEIIKLDNIKRDFKVGDETVHALHGVSFTIYEGEFVTIMGTSGSGKSTLLNTLGCLDTPTSGEYYLDGTSVRTMGKNARATLRNRKIGFVFQNYNLFRNKTALQNVTEGLVIARKMPKAQADAIRMINEANPNHNFLALRSMEAMEKVADGKATKLIVPSDMQNLAATVAAIKEAAADK